MIGTGSVVAVMAGWVMAVEVGLYPRRTGGGKNPDAQKTGGVQNPPVARRCACESVFLRPRVEVVRCGFHRQRARARRGIPFANHPVGRRRAKPCMDTGLDDSDGETWSRVLTAQGRQTTSVRFGESRTLHASASCVSPRSNTCARGPRMSPALGLRTRRWLLR